MPPYVKDTPSRAQRRIAGFGIAVGLALGVALGAELANLGVGVALGAIAGLLLEASLDRDCPA